jgi:hypothetical protein
MRDEELLELEPERLVARSGAGHEARALMGVESQGLVKGLVQALPSAGAHMAGAVDGGRHLYHCRGIK